LRVKGDTMDKLEVEKFIIAVREQVKKDEYTEVPERNTIVRLIIVITDRILNQKNRKNVVSAILGEHVESFNNLTKHTCFVLMDEIEKRQNGTEILRSIEEVVVDGTDVLPQYLYTFDRGVLDVSDMPETPESEHGDGGSARSTDNEGTSPEVEEQRNHLFTF
jgi:hypothetical protein